MTTPTSATQASAQARFAKDPSLLHQHLAEYCTKATEVEIDPKHVQIILGLHGEFQRSQAWKATKEADAKARTAAAKKALRGKRTDKIKTVTEPDERPDDSAFPYKVWTDEMVESEHGLVYAMLPIEPLKAPEGTEYTVIERVGDAADLQIHKKGCRDVAQYRKDKVNYHVRNVRGHDATHVAYIEISEVNQSDGVGAMGYDIDSVNILPCAWHNPEHPAAKSEAKKAAAPRKRPVKKAVSMDVTDSKVAEHKAIEADLRADGNTEEEVDQAMMELEAEVDRVAASPRRPRRPIAPRKRAAVKK